MRDNRLNRQPSGPGRSTRRSRAQASATAAPAPPPPPGRRERDSALARAAARLPRPRRGLGFTRRALVLFGLLAVLALSFAGSLRVWLVQGQELALARTQIEQRTVRIAELQDELQRWNDPAFVRAQARTRLGWVMPGEVGYRVIGPDGSVLSGSTDIEGVGTPHRNDLEARWWDRLALSLRHADAPEGAPR